MNQKPVPLQGRELVVCGRYVWVCVAKSGLLFVHDITIVNDVDGRGKCAFYYTADGVDCEIIVAYQALGLTYGDILEDGNFNRLYRFEEALYADLRQLARARDLVGWLRCLAVANPEAVAAAMSEELTAQLEPQRAKRPTLRLVGGGVRKRETTPP